MLKESQAKIMLSLQSKMNAKVNPHWVEASYPYLRAIIVEGAEAMEHHGWKWWKKQECDLEQLQMELVDIWHFTLSHILLEQLNDEPQALLSLMRLCNGERKVDFDGKTYNVNTLDTLQKLELSVGLACASRINVPLFEALMTDCKMDWNDLFCQYVGKNVLNFFRQDHGYKEGTYQKIWGGREDNEHLVEAMAGLDHEQADFQHNLYESLKDRYQKIVE
jgi:hypothetical protein